MGPGGPPKHNIERVFSVFAILLYLAGSFVLSITMPLMLEVGYLYNGNDPFVNLTTYLPDVGKNATA